MRVSAPGTCLAVPRALVPVPSRPSTTQHDPARPAGPCFPRGTQVPFVKIVSPNGLVGMSEAAKAAHIARVFDDAHKSPLSLVVLDELERLVEWVRIGPRFSNVVLQTLLTCVKRVPRTSKLAIIATTSSAATLEQLELLDAFNVSLHVPSLGHAEAMQVLHELGVSNIAAIEPTLRTVSKAIAIKKLMLVVEMSITPGKVVDPRRFATTLQETGLLD